MNRTTCFGKAGFGTLLDGMLPKYVASTTGFSKGGTDPLTFQIAVKALAV
jgi:hypothetical protein